MLTKYLSTIKMRFFALYLFLLIGLSYRVWATDTEEIYVADGSIIASGVHIRDLANVTNSLTESLKSHTQDLIATEGRLDGADVTLGDHSTRIATLEHLVDQAVFETGTFTIHMETTKEILRSPNERLCLIRELTNLGEVVEALVDCETRLPFLSEDADFGGVYRRFDGGIMDSCGAYLNYFSGAPDGEYWLELPAGEMVIALCDMRTLGGKAVFHTSPDNGGFVFNRTESLNSCDDYLALNTTYAEGDLHYPEEGYYSLTVGGSTKIAFCSFTPGALEALPMDPVGNGEFAYTHTDGTYLRSCKEYRALGDVIPPYYVPDGIYWVEPNGVYDPFVLYCDMTTNGGGWSALAYAKHDGVTVSITNTFTAWNNYSDFRIGSGRGDQMESLLTTRGEFGVAGWDPYVDNSFQWEVGVFNKADLQSGNGYSLQSAAGTCHNAIDVARSYSIDNGTIVAKRMHTGFNPDLYCSDGGYDLYRQYGGLTNQYHDLRTDGLGSRNVVSLTDGWYFMREDTEYTFS